MATIEERVAVVEHDTKRILLETSEIKKDSAEIKNLLEQGFLRLKKRTRNDFAKCREEHRKQCPINERLKPESWLTADVLKRALIGLGIIGSLIGGYYGVAPHPQPQQQITVGVGK